MKSKLSITVAAALAAGALVLNPAFAEDDAAEAPAAQNEQADTNASADAAPAVPAFPPGVKLDDDPEEEREGLFDTLADATEAALTKDGFDDFVERLVDQDRNRIGADEFTERKFADLNAKAEVIRTAWEAKYGDDVDVEEEAFAKLQAIVGEIDEPRALANAWPVPAVTDPSGAPGGEEAVPAAAQQTAGNEDPDLDSNIEKGREVAIAIIPASHGLPALNVSMIREVPGWRVDVPNRLSGQQLHDSLLKHLTHVAELPARQWPADENEAALLIAHHVLLGAYGVDLQPAGEEPAGENPDADARE